ncbi:MULTISPECIES: heavy-metal-associated domain-containing protein [Methanobrevibacter]|jgi:copper chaperone CopZ|uniref:heavy-metal-associated domain-containing protein n=1 Tax=Methanobrevibacter TaxID=2172 RepID=UPI003760763B|nr:heavy-metal-associated domain-containing protein [Methanobacteriaceae archaeon]
MIKKDIKVDGMHCNSCVLAVQNSLEDVEGILKANADLDSGIVKLELDSDNVSSEDINEAVKEVGFKVVK